MYPLFLEFYKYLHQIQKIYKNSQIFQKKSLCILIIKPKLTLPNQNYGRNVPKPYS